jgi:L-fuconolactonase
MGLIDSHHHVWQYNEKAYGWMDESMTGLKKDYLPADLEKEMKKAGVEGTVVVQARQILEETEWLLSLADNYDFIKGVVGWVDLRSGELPEQLAKYAEHPKFVGVRHVLHDEPELDFMLKDKFLRGIEMLADYDLAYDLLLFPEHLPNANKLVKLFPSQRFVIDHLAKPKIAGGIIEPWRNDIACLGTQPNVYCKISGMVTEADHKQWEEADFRIYMDAVCDSFGSDRLMLGSDWPVCRLAAEYEQVFDIPRNYFKEWDATEQEKIFRLNCIEFYKLEL